MISSKEAQELHELIGASLQMTIDREEAYEAIIAQLERAREIAALLVCDSIEEEGGRV